MELGQVEYKLVMERMDTLSKRVEALEGVAGLRPIDIVENPNAIAARIKRLVVERFPNTEIYGESQSAKDVFPRHIAMYLMRTVAKLSMPRIGRIFGRHHTTVVHAVEKIQQERCLDLYTQQVLDELEAKLSQEAQRA